MRKSRIPGITALALLAFPAQLPAHHGQAGIYDDKKEMKVEGVVTQFAWRNPHSALLVEGSNDAGTKGTFVIEMGAPAALINDYGISKSTFKPGDKVVIRVNPSMHNPVSAKGLQNHFTVNGVEFLSRNGRD